MSRDLDGFLKGLIKRRLPSQLAAGLGISHSTVIQVNRNKAAPAFTH